jgi:hypothetical protein
VVGWSIANWMLVYGLEGLPLPGGTPATSTNHVVWALEGEWLEKAMTTSHSSQQWHWKTRMVHREW